MNFVSALDEKLINIVSTDDVMEVAGFLYDYPDINLEGIKEKKEFTCIN